MSHEFVRVGDLTDLQSYPPWLQAVVAVCHEAEQAVAEHELFCRMRDAVLSKQATRNFLIGVWPVIEQFPQYMAANLLKVQFGRSRGLDMARRYLVRNIRVEQQHAEYWLQWAAASGISRAEVLDGSGSPAADALSHWCSHTCQRDPLPAAMAATNYAIEGVTGRWASLVCSSNTYENGFAPQLRKSAMKWLRAHAEYDARHPWEALDIIAAILGAQPDTREIGLVQARVRRSYEYMRMTLDDCLVLMETSRSAMTSDCPQVAWPTAEVSRA